MVGLSWRGHKPSNVVIDNAVDPRFAVEIPFLVDIDKSISDVGNVRKIDGPAIGKTANNDLVQVDPALFLSQCSNGERTSAGIDLPPRHVKIRLSNCIRDFIKRDVIFHQFRRTDFDADFVFLGS